MIIIACDYNYKNFDEDQIIQYFTPEFFLSLDFTVNDHYLILDRLASDLKYYFQSDSLFPYLAHIFPYDTKIIRIFLNNMYDPLKPDSKGNTPLHYVCKYNNDTEASVDLLLAYAPAATSITNNKGYLPIHIASKTNTNLNIIRKLYETFPDSIFITGANCLELAVAHNPNYQITQFFMNYFFPIISMIFLNWRHVPILIIKY